MRILSLLFAASLAALHGCGSTPGPESSGEGGKPAEQTAGASSAPANSGEAAPSDAEAKEFATSFEKTLASANIAAVDAELDADDLLRRAMLGINGTEDQRQKMSDPVRPLLTGPNGVLSFCTVPISAGGRMRFLRVHRQDNEQRALFRLVDAGDAINYFDFVLRRDAKGKVRIADFYAYTKGELMSDDLHCQLLVEAQRTNPQSLSPSDREYARNARWLQKIRGLVNSKQYQEALDSYDKMPESMKSHRHFLRQALLASLHLEGKLDEAVRAYLAAFPDNPDIDMYLLDYYFLHRQFDDMLACVDRTDRAVGGDPYLDAVRGRVYLRKHDREAAKRSARKSIEGEPNAVTAYSCLFAIAVAEKDYAQAGEMLTAIRDKFPGQMTGIEKIPECADYFRSPQYQAWKSGPTNPDALRGNHVTSTSIERNSGPVGCQRRGVDWVRIPSQRGRPRQRPLAARATESRFSRTCRCRRNPAERR